MTARTPAVGQAGPPPAGPSTAGPVRWRPLVLAALRQHRAALTAYTGVAVVVAVAMLVTGLVLHPAGHDVFAVGRHSAWPLFDVSNTALRPLLWLMPVMAGIFLGAPLVGRELEAGTARFAWTQGTGRVRWLIAQVAPFALLVAIIGIGLGLEFRWWADPLLAPGWPWRADLFALNPLPFAGWMLLGLSLAVFLGAAVRHTVPAMAGTLACSLALMVIVALTRLHLYVPPVHRAASNPTFSANGGFGYSMIYPSGLGQGPDTLSSALGWPDGRLLSQAQLHHSAAWFRSHHIQVWLTYQPTTRLGLFELIEFGWLAIASVLLIAATVILIRRRAA